MKKMYKLKKGLLIVVTAFISIAVHSQQINNSNNHYTDLQVNIGEDKEPKYIWSQITKVAEKKLKIKHGDNVFLLIKTMSLEGNFTHTKKIINS